MTTTLMATLLLTSLSASAAPQAPQGKMPPRGEFHKQITPEQKAAMDKRKAEMEQRLNITPEQKAQLKAIHEKSKAQIAPKIKQLTEAEHELQVLEKKQINKKVYGIDTLENVKLSGKSAEQLRTEIKTLRGDIREIRKANFEASQAVFTDAQKQELEKMRKEHEKTMKKHHKKFNKRPPMPPREEK